MISNVICDNIIWNRMDFAGLAHKSHFNLCLSPTFGGRLSSTFPCRSKYFWQQKPPTIGTSGWPRGGLGLSGGRRGSPGLLLWGQLLLQVISCERWYCLYDNDNSRSHYQGDHERGLGKRSGRRPVPLSLLLALLITETSRRPVQRESLWYAKVSDMCNQPQK